MLLILRIRYRAANLLDKYDGSGYGDIMDKEGFSFYINQSEDYFAKPLHKLDKSVAFNYYHIKK